MNRREFIGRSGKSALAVWAGSSLLLNACHTEADMKGKPNWIVEGDFNTPLIKPPIMGGDYSLIARASASSLKGGSAATYAYGNGILGPTIEANKGETIRIELQNRLAEQTNIHWHGLVLPSDMDGHPEDLAMAGGSRMYRLPVLQRAGTYWYHPHPHEATARQVFMGLAGLFIVRDEAEAALNLPSGEFEIPLIIQDKRFSGAALNYSPTEGEIMTGYLGEDILINGIHSPYQSVEGGWYRLRMLNGSTARVYQLGFSNSQTFYLIGTDGGLIQSPQALTSLMLAPGERADVLVNFGSIPIGGEIFLQSFRFSQFNVQGRQEFKLMKFRVDKRGTGNFQLPGSLSVIPTLSPTGARVRSLSISSLVGGSGGHGGGNKHGINGKIFQNDHIEFSVSAGDTEVWEFDNSRGDEIHPMHIHGVQFQVISRLGGRNQVFPFEQGWKDTVMVMPGEKVSVMMTFPDYRGKFVFHCHNLEHEDDGMMLNYEIV
jgi:blue copper oxidase